MNESAPTLHQPVLIGPVLDAARGARRVVDATLGHGGHAQAFRAAGAEVLGIDRDPDAVAKNLGIIKQYKPRVASMKKAYCK